MEKVVVLVPRGGRSPFQIYLLSVITLSGIAIAVGLTNNRITEAMGTPYNYFWGGFLFIGGFLSMLGIYWPKKPFTGLLVERFGLVALGGASFIWSFLVVWKTHMNGLFSGLLTFGLFLASVAQWRWVDKRIHTIMKAADDE